MSTRRSGSDGTCWRGHEDGLTASRWAPKSTPSAPNTRHKIPAAARHASVLALGGSVGNPKRPRRESLAAVGLSKGLESSCWASPNRANTPILTPNDLGSTHPDRAFRFGTAGSRKKKGKTAGLSANTHHPPHPPPQAPPSRRASAADGVDVFMGEPAPVSPRSFAYASSTNVVRDRDGDIVMQDLDDPSITSKIVEVVEGSRHVQPAAGPEGDYGQDQSCRVESAVAWVLVVDTNFILSHLNLVNSLVDAHRRWGNVVMLPWATIMELDGLKKSLSSVRPGAAGGGSGGGGGGDNVTVGMLARRANNWCFEKMARKAPGLWGQMKEEALDPTAVKGDAAILDCCRYIKESRGIRTALLSNDKNLCVQALVYRIKAISFAGTPFTADKIMSDLEGPRSRQPGTAWSGMEPFEEGGAEAAAAAAGSPHHDRKRAANATLGGIYASRYAVPSELDGRGGAGQGRREGRRRAALDSVKPLPPPPPSERAPSLQPAASAEESRSCLALLLLRIEGDLVANFIPLLARFWAKKPAAGSVPDPRTATGLGGVEAAVWACIQASFDHLLPSEGDVCFKLQNRSLSTDWSSWGHWSACTADSSVRAAKPTPGDVHDFCETWARIWNEFLHFSDNYARDQQTFLMSVGVWKALLVGLSAQL